MADKPVTVKKEMKTILGGSAKVVTHYSEDVERIKQRLFDTLPETYRNHSGLYDSLDALMEHDEVVDEETYEEHLYMFADKYLAALSSFEARDSCTAEYAYACKFVGYKSLGYGDGEAYASVFPNKVAKFYSEPHPEGGRSDYQLKCESLGNAFAKRVMVSKVQEVALVPLYISNAPLVQKAVDRLERLMYSQSERIALDAAATILDKVMKPDSLLIKHEHDLGEGAIGILDQFKALNSKISAESIRTVESSDVTIAEVDTVVKRGLKHG